MTKSRIIQFILLLIVFVAGVVFWGSSGSGSSNDSVPADIGPSPTP